VVRYSCERLQGSVYVSAVGFKLDTFLEDCVCTGKILTYATDLNPILVMALFPNMSLGADCK
jgi:hypothetical protein